MWTFWGGPYSAYHTVVPALIWWDDFKRNVPQFYSNAQFPRALGLIIYTGLCLDNTSFLFLCHFLSVSGVTCQIRYLYWKFLVSGSTSGGSQENGQAGVNLFVCLLNLQNGTNNPLVPSGSWELPKGRNRMWWDLSCKKRPLGRRSMLRPGPRKTRANSRWILDPGA